MRISNLLFLTALGMTLVGTANADGSLGGEIRATASHPVVPNQPTPPSVATMVCHEAGGSGYPLTDYVNNIDLAIWNAASESYTNTLPNGFAIYPETSSNPTSCALATSQLVANGLTLKQVFSHFPGYYIEVFSTQ
jgi:hypothetical protein